MEQSNDKKKEFALNAIRPYVKDPKLCALEDRRCVYMTADGRKCVLGKYLLNNSLEFADRNRYINASSILKSADQSELVPEARGILTALEWERLQAIHDQIANYGLQSPANSTERAVQNLGLFTYEEMMAD